MKKGTLIKITRDYVYHFYYELKDEPFEIYDDRNDHTYKINGRHFVCLGSNYFHGASGSIACNELLDQEYEIIYAVPESLIK